MEFCRLYTVYTWRIMGLSKYGHKYLNWGYIGICKYSYHNNNPSY